MSSSKTGIATEESLASSNPLDAIPENMPFGVPYGPAISLDRAQAVIQVCCGRGQGAELEDERSNSRFRR